MKKHILVAFAFTAFFVSLHIMLPKAHAVKVSTCTIDTDCPPGQICDMGSCVGGGGGAPEFPGGSLYAIMAGASGGLFWIRRFFKR